MNNKMKCSIKDVAEATANGVEFRFVVTVAADIVSENMKGVVGVVVVYVSERRCVVADALR